MASHDNIGHILRIMLLVISLASSSGHPVLMQLAAIQSVPPNVSLSPMLVRNSGSFIYTDPLFTNSLFQALSDESEHKKRVQRYRDVA